MISRDSGSKRWQKIRRRERVVQFVLAILFSLAVATAWAQDQDVVKAQRLLNALGFDAGKADGALGPRTQRAIQAYQRSNNLPPTGDLDTATLIALGLAEAPLEPEAPPPPSAPPEAWRTVLAYLRYYDTQPSRLVSYVTAQFRQGMPSRAWIQNTMRDIANKNFARLWWRIERMEPQASDTASEATVEVYSRVRIAGQEQEQREIFSLVRADETTWLIDSIDVSQADPQVQKSNATTAGR